MSDGVLLAEDSPSSLIKQFGVNVSGSSGLHHMLGGGGGGQLNLMPEWSHQTCNISI